MAAPDYSGCHNSLQMDSFWLVPTVSAIPTDDEVNERLGALHHLLPH